MATFLEVFLQYTTKLFGLAGEFSNAADSADSGSPILDSANADLDDPDSEIFGSADSHVGFCFSLGFGLYCLAQLHKKTSIPARLRRIPFGQGVGFLFVRLELSSR